MEESKPISMDTVPAVVAAIVENSSSGDVAEAVQQKNYIASFIPAFIRGNTNILVPIKIDFTCKGARIVDTFCWDLYQPAMSPEEFSGRTCLDLNLPLEFQQRIALQLIEQLEAYQLLVECIKLYAPRAISHWVKKIHQKQIITIGIRHGSIDFSDKIEWDPMDDKLTPEEFATITASDLGLPHEIEPAIAHKIREALFRWMYNILLNPNLSPTETNLQPEFKVNETKAVYIQPGAVIDMTNNLWKRAKPNTIEEYAAVPQPQLPTEKDTNSGIWTAPIIKQS